MPKVWEQYIPYLHLAMASTYGIKVRTSNVKLSQAHIYKARAELADPDHKRLQVRPHPKFPNEVLMIIKGPEPEKKL